MLKDLANDSFQGKTVVISGSGNVAQFACQKATQLGGKVVTMSDSNGYIYDPNGINLDIVLDLKNVKRARISEYAKLVPGSEYHEGSKGVWTVKCDIALPCATQNELDLEGAKALIANGVKAVAEGANMPSTPEAIEAFQKAGVLFGPAKAANAGGVATSLRRSGQEARRHHEEHLRRCFLCRCQVRPEGQPRHGCKHRWLPQGCRCHEVARCSVILKKNSLKKASRSKAGGFSYTCFKFFYLNFYKYGIK